MDMGTVGHGLAIEALLEHESRLMILVVAGPAMYIAWRRIR